MDSKISQLTSGTPATSDTGVMVQGGVTKKFTIGDLPVSTATQTALNSKQDTLVSGTNIKTVNGESLLGSGNITISGTGLVDSVNGQTGVVVLDADDISDTTTTKKFTTAGDISKLAGIEAGAEVNNISDVNATDLTDGGDSTLHYHASDRNRANHTGTQSISTVTNLQTELDKQKGIILSDTDANTITTGGRYGMIGTPTNGAITGEFALEVFNDGTRVMQIATYLSGVVYTRYYNGSAWSAWVKYSDDAKANISGVTFTGRVETSEATAVASASTVDLNTINGNFVHITGTTTINSFGATARGSYELCFDSAGLTITNGAIRLPTSANITTQAGDTMIVRGETTTGDWRVISYQRKDGSALYSAGGGGGGFWTLMPGTPTRTSNTTFTVTGDVTAYVAKGMVIKWTESGTVRCGMVSIPSTYSSPNTTITIIGDTMASIDASSLKYGMVGIEGFVARFAIAGSIGATGTDVANAYYATEPMRVIGADLQVGTAGTTNSTTIDINKGGTTMFTTKPTLATTVASSPTPFTADTATSLALGDKVTIDIDAVQSTPAVDLYAQLYLFPTRLLSLT